MNFGIPMTDLAHILIVDDDEEVRTVVARGLKQAGYSVSQAGEGRDVPELVKTHHIALVIVDLTLPDMDGLTLTRRLKEHSNAGVIILSGRDETSERIIGLEIGADDYVTKPFVPRELLARVRSVLRRLKTTSAVPAADLAAFEFDGWRLEIASRRLTSPEQKIVNLSSGEFNLLRTLLENPNQVVSRERILDFTHDQDAPVYDRSVDVQIARLRQKIERHPQRPELIKTIRNGGYLLATTVQRI